MTQSSSQPDYFALRAEQERAAAERSTDTTVRRVHIDMAERYTALLDREVAAAV